jgi:tRNA G37 N-methylase Trm5
MLCHKVGIILASEQIRLNTVKKKIKPKRQKSDEFVIERSNIELIFNPTNLYIANCSSGDRINIYGLIFY